MLKSRNPVEFLFLVGLVHHIGQKSVKTPGSEFEDRQQSCFALVLVDVTTNYLQIHFPMVIVRGFCMFLFDLFNGVQS